MDQKIVFTPFEVIHDKIGNGTAIGYCVREENTFLKVRFSNGENREFVFPDQFVLHLKATEPEVQNQIKEIINDFLNPVKKREVEKKPINDYGFGYRYDLQDFPEHGQVDLQQREKSRLLKARFNQYLILEGYRSKSLSGNPSTIPQYVSSVEKVCEREGCTWTLLASRIGIIVHRYDIGGREEEFGNLSHRTVVNALKRFQEFIENYDITNCKKADKAKNDVAGNDEPTLIELLGKDLKQMYEKAPENEKNTMVLLFGIMNEYLIGDLTLTYGLNEEEIVMKIVRAAGIQSSYQAEVSKGVRLSKYVKVKSDVKLPD